MKGLQKLKLMQECSVLRVRNCSLLLSTTGSSDLSLLDTSDLLDSTLDFLSLLSGLGWFS
jgi:hypothetical protein